MLEHVAMYVARLRSGGRKHYNVRSVLRGIFWNAHSVLCMSGAAGDGRTIHIASSPAPSQLFSLAGKKRERAWDLKSRDKCWQNGVALALPQSVDFKPVWRFRSIKRSSARPLRIVLPSLTVSMVFFFTRIKLERSKIALAHAQFSRSATLPTLVYGPTSRT